MLLQLFLRTRESKYPIEIRNIDAVTIPKIFWIHHGSNRLADHFKSPVQFFPFAMDRNIFNCSKALKKREIDISFVGSRHNKYYRSRDHALNLIHSKFSSTHHLSLNSQVYLDKMAAMEIQISYLMILRSI